MRLFPLVFALFLATALPAGACGGDADLPAPSSAPTAAASDTASDPDAALADLSALTRSFFEALARGDGPAVYALLSSQTQGQTTLDNVTATARAVAQATPNPGFVLNGLTLVSLEENRAEFLIDGYLTRNGDRVGSAEEAQNAAPLVAVRENGAWRLLVDPAFFRVGGAQLTVER